jgi:hypothetical protein
MVTAAADWGAYDGWHGSREVSGATEALALCHEIEAREPRSRMLLGFTRAAGHYFSLGLGAEDSCVMFWESADPPYFQSRGDRPEVDLIDFAYAGHHTEISGTARIDRDSAFAALAEFMETGRRPKCIAWQET